MQAVVEHTGLYLGECGSCYGSFVYRLEEKPMSKDLLPGAKVRSFITGVCPLCGAQIKSLVK